MKCEALLGCVPIIVVLYLDFRVLPNLLILLAYRSAVHERTGQTPSFLMFGTEVNLPVDLLFGHPPSSKETETVED